MGRAFEHDLEAAVPVERAVVRRIHVPPVLEPAGAFGRLHVRVDEDQPTRPCDAEQRVEVRPRLRQVLEDLERIGEVERRGLEVELEEVPGQPVGVRHERRRHVHGHDPVPLRA
ncbi:MAG TPA: hypothetical protein VF212_07590 [Longimicrobiales bacterium]